ncbi:MAG: hypothetical protein QME40_00370 [bacterium]|nr:hypothetical protein [bacterium]
MRIFILMVVLTIICGCGKKEEVSYPDRVTKPEDERFVLEETFRKERPEPPLYVYRSFKRRDPFVPLIQKEEEKRERESILTITNEEIFEVNIRELTLSGIIWDRGGALALLSSIGGFGYILKNGRLLGENDKPVEGVFGQIIGDNCVILSQGNKKITLYLGKG